MGRRRPSLGVLLALGLGGSVPARAADIVSPRAEAVGVTIYRDGPMTTRQLIAQGDDDTRGLALIVETRILDLPAGRSRVHFEGVADGILPQSAAVEGLPGALVERNFDYDLLSPGTLLTHAIGQGVTLVRTEARTGRETRNRAIVRSAPDGVVLDFGDHAEALRCGGETERLVFDHTPAGLTDRPTLSVVVDAPAAVHATVRLSYLSLRLDWAADYIARINPDGRTLTLTGWITLVNRGATGFADAPTEVVAGRLSRVDPDAPDTPEILVQSGCWPGQTTHGGWAAKAEALRLRQAARAPPMMAMAASRAITVTAQKRAIESQLGDYKLYTLAEPTTVAARQTKQVLFLSQPSVAFRTVYRTEISGDDTRDPSPAPTDAIMTFENRTDRGLGRPLPAGSIGVRRRAIGEGREIFVGEYPLARDTPIGEPFELSTGQASDVTVAVTRTLDTSKGGPVVRQGYRAVANNAKTVPVTVEIRHDRNGAAGFKVAAESARHDLKAGDPVWRLAIPAQGQATLTYTVSHSAE